MKRFPRHLISVVSVLGTCAVALMSQRSNASSAPCDDSQYEAGAAHGDITGPIADVGMMGYAEPSQVSEGLHMRLRSRALVLKDVCTAQTVAIVTNEMGMVFYGLKRAILQSLDHELPGVFRDENLLISATHTHAGPGGYAHHLLYNFTTFGFHPDVFDSLRRGTVQAILKAYKNTAPARLTLTHGELEGIQFNRSPDAYEKNPEKEKKRYGRDHDPTMTLLKVANIKGHPIAAFNWFGIHPVSLPLENRLISGDNKGLAAYQFEKSMGTTYQKDRDFVAAFVQESAGDISPYPLTQAERADKIGFARNAKVATAQADRAMQLFRDKGKEISGPIAASHQFINLAGRIVPPASTGESDPQKTCLGSLGVSFAAGTENGQPLKIFREGTIYGINWPRITVLPREQRCQSEKVVLLPTGLMKPWPWTATVAPFQLIRIGSLVIVATPFEITTMAGRRLREEILKTLEPAGIQTVVISSLANEYLHYVTTREEYAQQAYEGGSNLFGPWSLAAYTDIYKRLAKSLLGAPKPDDERQPLDLSQRQIVLKRTPTFDVPPAQAFFGGVVQAPRPTYSANETAEATFWCANPNRQADAEKSYLTVERQAEDAWIIVRQDWDDDTFFIWKKPSNKEQSAQCVVQWLIPQGTLAGMYRLCHNGIYNLKAASSKPYTGCTQAFSVRS
jgi:neutral ceramidase